MPKFSETDVPKYFYSFKKLMKIIDCPPKYWTVLLQSVLVGKALEAYSSIDEEQSCDYEVVKDVILKAFKLVPEAYRLKFRSFKKEDNKTYLEFARAKEQSFNEWCKSVEVKTLDDLHQLMLLEDFKKNLPRDIRIYVEENQVKTLHRAAELADEYHLIHYFNN